jgi:hypothetical protein
MKRKLSISFFTALLLLFSGLFLGVFADENINDKSQLTVPWDEFKKLIHLAEDEIVLSLETFQKLLEQTGTKTTPAHTSKGGNVVLTRAQFEKIVSRMKPHPGLDIKPPFDYLITKAIYSGKMKKKNTSFIGTFYVHILKKDAYLKVPFLSQNIALEDVKVDGKEALVVSENGYHHVVLSKPGEHAIDALFSLKSSLEKGPHKLDLTIRKTPITLLKLEMPLKDIDVEIPQAQQVLTSLKGSSTVISAVIAPGSMISIRWRKRVAIAEKIPPKLYSEAYHLVSIEDDALKIHSDINYSILHSEVDRIRFSIPEDVNVLTVQGEGVGEWQELTKDDERIIVVPFTYSKKGSVLVRIKAEKTLSEKGNITSFSGIRVLDTVRERGFIGIELNTSAEVTVAEVEGLERVVVQKLPRVLYNKSAKPLILGFKYLKHPYALALDIKKHEKIAVPIATINSGSAVTLFTEDGKIVHRLVYQIRNSAKQFLEVQLPEKADIWSVFVGKKPVESSMNAKGKLLVPLIRSRSVDNRLDTFPVEIIFCVVKKRFSPLSFLESSLPAVDLLISQLIWSVYLPNDYSYIYFKSTLEKEEMIRGLNIFTKAKRQYDDKAMKELSISGEMKYDKVGRDRLKTIYKKKLYQSKFRNLPLQEEQLSSQVDAELEFGGRLEGLAKQEIPQATVSSKAAATGILPIQIEVPTGGQVYRFAKTIIKPEDPLTFRVTYTQLWIVRSVKWLFVALVIWVLYLNRKKFKKAMGWSKERSEDLSKLYKGCDDAILKSARSIITPIALLGLIIVFSFVSKMLTLLTIFLFFVCVGYQVSIYRKKKKITVLKQEDEDNA